MYMVADGQNKDSKPSYCFCHPSITKKTYLIVHDKDEHKTSSKHHTKCSFCMIKQWLCSLISLIINQLE